VSGAWPLAVVTVLYGWQIVEYFLAGRAPMGVVFAGYALANCGLIWDFWRHT